MAYTQKSICYPTIDVCVPYFYDKHVQLFGNNKRKFFWGMRLGMNDKVELSRRTTSLWQELFILVQKLCCFYFLPIDSYINDFVSFGV